MKFWHKNNWNQFRDCGRAAFERKGMLYPIYFKCCPASTRLKNRDSGWVMCGINMCLWMRHNMPAGEQLMVVASVTRWPWASSVPVAVGAKLHPTPRTVMSVIMADNENAGACTLFVHIHEQVNKIGTYENFFEFTTICSHNYYM